MPVVTGTWQFTVVASLFVYSIFGNRTPGRVWLFSFIIFCGICLINVSHADKLDLNALVHGGIPVLIAAFCYPLGNQLVWETKHGQHSLIPKIDSPLLNNALAKVFLLSLGSIPLWLIVGAIIHPPAPSGSQVFNTAIVALLSGVIATSIFLHARNMATNTTELTIIDATQAGEVIFALMGGMPFLNAELPNSLSMLGLVIVISGLMLFLRFQKK